MTIIEDYLKLTKQYINEYGPKTILLMQVGSFFEVYAITENDGSYSGSNITDFSQINDMIIAKKNMFYQDKQVVMAGFGLTQLEKYSKKYKKRIILSLSIHKIFKVKIPPVVFLKLFLLAHSLITTKNKSLIMLPLSGSNRPKIF